MTEALTSLRSISAVSGEAHFLPATGEEGEGEGSGLPGRL